MTLKNIKIDKVAITLFVMIVFFIFLNCTKSKVAEETSIEKKSIHSRKNEVETIVLKNEAFQKELVSNGKIIATQET